MSDRTQNLVILGMHRSGTSALAGAFAAMGWQAGPSTKLMPADKDNPRGYFERLEFAAVNEDLLTSAARKELGVDRWERPKEDAVIDGLGWVFGAWLDSSNFDKMDFDQLLESQVQQFERELTNDTPFVIKDPRLSLTLGSWQKFLPAHRSLIMLRHPGSVARSLFIRNRFPEAISHALWILYTASALRHTTIGEKVVIVFEELIDNPRRELTRTAGALGLTVDNESLRAGAAVIDKQFVHNKFTPQSVPQELERIYHALKDGLPHGTEMLMSLAARERQFHSWMQGLILLERKATAHAAARALKAESALTRLNRHPLVGPLLRVLRRIKGDTTFGAVNSRDKQA